MDKDLDQGKQTTDKSEQSQPIAKTATEMEPEWNEADEQDEEKPVAKWKVALTTALTVFILFALVGGGGALYVYTNLQPVVANSTEPVRVEIPSGSSTKQIATILEEKGLIRNAYLYSYYLKWKGDEVAARLQAGTYDFIPGSSLEEITSRMVRGDVVQMATQRITIPEGWNVLQIADYLVSEGLVERDEFLKEVEAGEFDYTFIAEIRPGEGINHRLEGFLFPDTYDIPQGATAHEIVAMMLRNFERQVTPTLMNAFAKQGLSFYDAITLASIVEREVILDEERPIVAGVFYNRMQDQIRLESCATVQYVLGKQKDVITYDDLEVESPFNTYKHDGLPPGPIGNPGLASIEAVAYPAEHDYYFFVTKKDGSKGHHFARTYAEHLQNDANSRGSW